MPGRKRKRPFLDDANLPTIPLKIEDWSTVIVMAFLVCITFANVVMRYFTSSSFAYSLSNLGIIDPVT